MHPLTCLFFINFYIFFLLYKKFCVLLYVNSRKIMSYFSYNPKNHCWPAVRKALFAIITGTLLMTICEAMTIYELDKSLQLSGNTTINAIFALAIANTFILRKHVRIIQARLYRRFAYVAIGMLSVVATYSAMNIEKDARAIEMQSETLDGIDFDKADYFRIAEPGNIDTTRIGYDIARYTSHSRSGMTSLTFRGYCVAPFHDKESVFYAIDFKHEGTRPFLITEKARHEIWQQFAGKMQQNNPDSYVHSHLFKRLMPDEDSPYWVAVGYSCAMDTVTHDIYEIHRSVLLSPVDGDRMPAWQDTLCSVLIILGFTAALLVLIFAFAKTRHPLFFL